VHLLLCIEDGRSLAAIMHKLKGASAHRVFARFPDLKLDLGHNSFWQRGYGYREVPPNNIVIVREYILNHRESEPRVFNPRGR